MPTTVVAWLLAKPVDMSVSAELSKLIETFKFWDIIAQWSRERLEHESIVARALAHAVVRDGLPLWSVDPRWIQNKGVNMEFRGQPFVGFRAQANAQLIVIRASSLQHLQSIVDAGVEPAREPLSDEFIYREDFRLWLTAKGLALPGFWY
ncbi:MAG: hypothetical protein ACI8PT_004111 [Gammaproteobacteria bacterium]|jgi:hypothetical protein